MLAKYLIDNAAPLIIANCDQYIDIDIDTYYHACGSSEGLIMTMPGDDPKWSYVKYDSKGNIVGVVEKQVVSNEATVGIYHYRHGSDFVRHAEAMIAENERVNGEFYVAPVYSRIIAAGGKVGTYNIGNNMYGLGIPADLDFFHSTEASRRLLARA
ncbi:hypothetical protein PPNSA23_41710 [Phyllobacterium phragmitis]|uniref:Nucleotidyl transferase domain-containing protein n=1 Tax=Phyllobacterium phragmitis TaxID=2670329 RepID=A0ABQ0H5L4_9HYPH